MIGLGTPSAARVEVCLADVSGMAMPTDGCFELLDGVERTAAARLRRAKDRHRYNVSHLLLRWALSRATQERVSPAQWRFERSAGGRPSVAPGSGLPRLNFSLSRSSGLAAVAVANADVACEGIDAERSDRPLHWMPSDVALSPPERSRLAGYSPARQPVEFLKLWTLKEAYAKLRGRGVSLPFEEIEIAVTPIGLVRTEDRLDPPDGLHLERRQVRTAAALYCTSLAVQAASGVRPRIEFHLIDTLWPDDHGAPRLPADTGAAEHEVEPR